ncbi:Non-functional pseudokinase ZRK15 [Cardamine amara subsp. amara]|uniref:Non-functional pseudokinase ZRK15 n=1 Tax=Cardamine amara subsp. amara TaxID=228776 RepID=A0ABD0ZIR5_CARAN
MDDDFKINHIISEKTDAYGFGIFMQKLLTGEERFHELWHHSNNKFPSLLSKSIEDGKMNEIMDPKMLENMHEVTDEELHQMEAFFVLSERCIGLRGEVPKMMQVAKELKKFS